MKIGFVKPLCLLFAVWWSSILLADSQVEELFDAVVENDVKQVATLLESGVDVNTPIEARIISAFLDKRHSFFYAIMLVRDVEVARLLIAAGAKVDDTDEKHGISTLHWVIGRTCNAELIEVLIKEGGADPNATAHFGLAFPSYPLTPTDTAAMLCGIGADGTGATEMLLTYGGDGKLYRELLEKKNKE